jgi:hypothetical protein
MVLRLTISVVVLLSLSSAWANETRVYREAFAAHQARNYATSLRILRQHFDLYNAQAPQAIILLAAFNFEGLQDFPEARNLYQILLRRRYEDEHIRAVRTYQEAGHAFDLDELPRPLVQLYERLMVVEFALYKQNYREFSQAQRDRARELITMYANICLENDCDIDQVDVILNELDTLKVWLERTTKQWYAALTLSYASWRDRVEVKNPNEIISLVSSVKGPCVGGEIGHGNDFWEWGVGACLSFAKGSVTHKDSPTAEYFEARVPVNSFHLSPIVRWKPLGAGASLGVELPLIYRSGDFSVPEGYELQGNRTLNLGLGINFNWQFESLGVHTKLQKVSGFESTVFQFGVSYRF